MLTTPNYPRSFQRLLIRSLFSKTTQLSNWSHTLQMSLGIPKCKTLNISSKKLLSNITCNQAIFLFFFGRGKKNREYHIDETLLTTASETIDLGIKPLLTDNLQSSQLINQIFLRANHTLNKPYCQLLFGRSACTPPQTDGWTHEFAIVNYHKSDCCLLKSSRQHKFIFLKQNSSGGCKDVV